MLTVFKIGMVSFSIILFALITIGKLFVFHKKSAIFVSDYTSNIALALVFYVLFALFGVFLFKSLTRELIFLFLALSPFALGYLAKYETEKYFTVIQLLLFVFTAAYTLVI